MISWTRHSWWMQGSGFVAHACDLREGDGHLLDLPLDTNVQILAATARQLGETAVVIFDPLAPLREHRRSYAPDVRRRAAAFVRRFPGCASSAFNGALVVSGTQIPKGIRAVLDIYEFCHRGVDLSLVFKRSRALVVLCHYAGMHFCAKTQSPVAVFAAVFRECTGTTVDVQSLDP